MSFHPLFRIYSKAEFQSSTAEIQRNLLTPLAIRIIVKLAACSAGKSVVLHSLSVWYNSASAFIIRIRFHIRSWLKKAFLRKNISGGRIPKTTLSAVSPFSILTAQSRSFINDN